MKKKIVAGMFLILAIALALALGFEAIDISSVSAEVYSPNENITWINAEIEDLEKKSEMQIAGWIISTGIKEVDIWVYELTPENQQLDGKMIGDWKVNVWEDQKPPEDGEATDEEVAWIRDQIKKWKENPEMQIGATAILRTEKTVVLWVYEGTPENMQLYRKMINGWEIIVVESSMPTDDMPTDEEIAWIKDQIEKWKENPEMRVDATAILRAEKTVVLWVYERTPENQQLHRKMINGWGIIVVEIWPTDEEIAWIRDQIERWKENPEMQIGGTSIDSSARKTVTLWVYERTPVNQQLHHEMIGGWEIIIAESPKPSVFDTFAHPPGLWIPIGCLLVIMVAILVKYRGRKRNRMA